MWTGTRIVRLWSAMARSYENLAEISAAWALHGGPAVRELAAKLAAGLIMLIFLALVSWGVWALNRWAVRKCLDPRLEELEKLHQSLLA